MLSSLLSLTWNPRRRLPNGGYGYLGICMDSAAAIQQALTGQVTLFPLVLCGKVKSRVMLLYKVSPVLASPDAFAWACTPDDRAPWLLDGRS